MSQKINIKSNMQLISHTMCQYAYEGKTYNFITCNYEVSSTYYLRVFICVVSHEFNE